MTIKNALNKISGKEFFSEKFGNEKIIFDVKSMCTTGKSGLTLGIDCANDAIELLHDYQLQKRNS